MSAPKVFMAGVEPAFWEAGVGALAWEHIGGWRVLIALVPDTVDGEQFEVAVLYTDHATGNWAKPGPVSGWNGNIRLPTLTPSVQMPRGGWHGFIRRGRLIELDGATLVRP